MRLSLSPRLPMKRGNAAARGLDYRDDFTDVSPGLNQPLPIRDHRNTRCGRHCQSTTSLLHASVSSGAVQVPE